MSFSDCDESNDSESGSEYYDSDTDSEYQEIQADDATNKFADIFHWVLLLVFFWYITHNVSAAALNELLQLLSCIFSLMGELLSSPVAVGLTSFPATLYLAYKYLQIEPDRFMKYVLCPKCHTLYDHNEFMKDNVGTLKRCMFVRFPSHPLQNR